MTAYRITWMDRSYESLLPLINHSLVTGSAMLGFRIVSGHTIDRKRVYSTDGAGELVTLIALLDAAS